MKLRSGQALIEMLVALALVSLFMPALITSLVASRDSRAQQRQRSLGIALLQETQEEIRIIRESGWSNFTACISPCHPIRSGNSWTFSSGTETINGITRRVDLIDVYRDNTTDQIVQSLTGSSYTDTATYKILITITWTTPYAGSIVSRVYMTRYLDNIAVTQTSVSDFNGGSLGSAPDLAAVTRTPADDGNVILSNIGHGDWCNPDPNEIAPANIPITAPVRKVRAVPGEAYLSAGNGSGQNIFVDMTFDNPPYPTPETASLRGVYAEAVSTFGLWGDANYVYLSTSNNAGEVYVMQVATPTPGSPNTFRKLSSYDSKPGSSGDDKEDGIDVYVYNDRAFLTKGNKWLVILDVSDPANPKFLTQFKLRADGLSVVAYGKYAYVALDHGVSEEMQVVDVGGLDTPTPAPSTAVATPFYAAWGDLSTGSAGTDVYVNPEGTRLYTTTDRSTEQDCYSGNGPSPASGSTPAVGTTPTKLDGCEMVISDLTTKTRWGTIAPTVPAGTPTPTFSYTQLPSMAVAGAYDSGSMQSINGFSLVRDYRQNDATTYPTPTLKAVLVGKVTITTNPFPTQWKYLQEYTVLDLSKEKFPSRCASVDFNNGILGVSAVREDDGDAYAYMATGDSTNNFRAIQGGPGVYGTLGVFTSSAIDAGSTTVFNHLHANITRLNGTTDVKLQVAVANSSNCSTATYAFVGPGGSSSTYFTSSDDIGIDAPMPVGTYGSYVNPGRCLKYKAFLSSTDSNRTPQLLDFTVNYSP